MSSSAKETGTNVAHERLASPNITITEPGFVYIYISNEEATPIDVFFDDLKVTQNMSEVVAGADYYPFGFPIPERELTREPYRYGYQGQYSEKDKETGFNFFDLRMYDARIGRWVSPDPYGEFWSSYIGMGNNPVTSTDPDGGCISCIVNTMRDAFQNIFGNMLDEVVVTAKITGGEAARQYFMGTLSGLIKPFANTISTIAHPIDTYNNVKNMTPDDAKNMVNDGLMKLARSVPVPLASEMVRTFDLAKETSMMLNGDFEGAGEYRGEIIGDAALEVVTLRAGAVVKPIRVAKTGGNAFRYMSQAELEAVQSTGLLRGGRAGETFFTKDLYKSAASAQNRLALPSAPTLRVEFQILNNPTILRNGTKVLPANGRMGRGAEFMTLDPVKVRLINWQPLR